jgi:CheY-like chemotaxis protein
MIFDAWNVLIVDDEPDILAVSKLALRDVLVYDLPLQLYTAKSKAEAIELLNDELAIMNIPEGSMAVALVDVVMETDHAGLELCNYIRNDLRNKVAQLYIRTGQPGIAPERKVIDDFDISGYFTKVEATEQKLYTFVKSGIRQWFSIYYSKIISDQTMRLINAGHSRQGILDVLGYTGDGFDEADLVSGIVFEDVVCSDQSEAAVFALRKHLSEVEPMFVSREGHSLTVEGRRLMVYAAPTDTTVEYWYVSEGKMALPESLLELTYNNGISLASLWKHAK